MFRLILGMFLSVVIASIAIASQTKPTLICEIDLYSNPKHFAGNSKEQLNTMITWMPTKTFYVDTYEEGANLHVSNGHQIDSYDIRVTEQRHIYRFRYYPKSSNNVSHILEYDLKILDTDMSFQLELALRKQGYYRATGRARGFCVQK